MHLDQAKLSFAELDRRISALPDGPSSYLTLPAWTTVLNVVGTLGMAMGLLPSVLIRLMDPQLWMVNLAWVGLWTAIAAYAIPFGLTVWAVVRSLTRWKPQLTEQMDHDFVEIRSLVRWLQEFPIEDIDRLIRFASLSRESLTQKLGFLAGGMDRLGIVPVVVALALQATAFVDSGQPALWQAILGVFAALLYAVTTMASLMRLRIHLYESILTEAKAARAV